MCLGRLGSRSGLYMDYEQDSVHRALVDTGSTVFLVRVALLTERTLRFGATEHDMLQITTVTKEQVIMREKYLLVQSGTFNGMLANLHKMFLAI